MRLVLLMLALVASPAWAEWVPYGENSEATNYYDPATIRVNGNLRRVWQVQDYKERGKEGPLSSRVMFDYDCKDERYRILFYSDHSGPMVTGNALGSANEPSTWSYVPPGYNSAFMLKLVCAVR